MFDRLISTVVAIFLAVLVWLYARSRDQENLDHVPIPVSVSLPSGQTDQYAIEVVGQPQVLASFTGSPPRIRELRGLLQRDEMHVELTLNLPDQRLKENRASETLTVVPADLKAPAGVTTTLVPGRNQVRVVLHRLGQKQVPVRFDRSLESQAGPVTIDPPSVLVRGPVELLEKATAIPTQPWVLRDSETGDRPAAAVLVPLVKEIDGRPVQCEPSFVQIRCGSTLRKTYELTDVPVNFLCPPSFPFRPRFANERAGKVTLRVTGPPQEELPRAYVFVDLTGKSFAELPSRDGQRVRLMEEPIQVQLPRDFQLEGSERRNLPFELVPTPLPADDPFGK